MLFNSFNFWLVFPFIFSLYWIVPCRFQQVKKWVLIIASYLLYVNWKPSFALVLFGVTVITYFGASFIAEGRSNIFKSVRVNQRKSLCIIFGIIALIPLVTFKYYNFVNNTFSVILLSCGLNFSLPGLNWAIPVGISFYTFQALGYMWDVYYNKIRPERNFTDYILFCSFFPQTASGPISRYAELMPQIKEPHPFCYSQGVEGFKVLLWGMILKVVIADRLGIYVDTVYDNYEYYSGASCFMASLFYTMQIYCDFAGYSLMAVGIGKCLGFNLVDNFKRPYLAVTITDFWRRWHISLTRWLTSYVYIPLGGSRCSRYRNYYNIMVTFVVSGLWHGANYTFLVWGILHGVLLIFEKVIGLSPKGRYCEVLNHIKIFNPMRIFLTFMLVSFAWIFFRMPTMGDAISVICKIWASEEGMQQETSILIFLLLGMLISKELVEEYCVENRYFINSKHMVVRWGSYLFLIALLLLFGVFDATQFIYVNF